MPNEDFEQRLERIEKKIDDIKDDLTVNLSRIATTEEAISWLKGHVKIVTLIGLTLLGSLVPLFIKVFV